MEGPTYVNVLSVAGLSVQFGSDSGASVRAVDGISFQIGEGEVVGLVGESGSGKSATALSIAGLLSYETGARVLGQIEVAGMDMSAASEAEWRQVRRKTLGVIFQDPMTSLNPTMRVGRQIAERLKVSFGQSRRDAGDSAVEWLGKLGIADPRNVARMYPFELSGGMRQRVVIAMALCVRPKLVLADEPTSALDVTVQNQILELLASLCAELNSGVLLITHDLAIASRMCNSINVMYAGEIVESGPAVILLRSPQMPYTFGLLKSTPSVESDDRDWYTIPGRAGMVGTRGCRFEPRCAFAREICRSDAPLLAVRNGQTHHARCWGSEPGGWVGEGELEL